MDASEVSTMPARRTPQVDRGGTWVMIGETEFKVPPLNFRALREHMDSINRLSNLRNGASPGPQDFASISAVVHAALARNYPQITLDEVEDMLDIGNMTEVLNAVMAMSGLVRREGEPGEVKAAP